MPAAWDENTGGIGMLLALYLPWAMGKRQAAYRCTRINSLLARSQRAFLMAWQRIVAMPALLPYTDSLHWHCERLEAARTTQEALWQIYPLRQSVKKSYGAKRMMTPPSATDGAWS